MHILHIIASADLNEGGPIEHAVSAGRALQLRGHLQDFLTFDAPGSIAQHDIDAQVFAMGARRSGTGWPAKIANVATQVPKAARWLRANARNYDVIIVSGLWNISTLTARLCLPRGPTPYVLFTHGMLDPYFRRAAPFKSAIKQLLWLFNERVLVRRAARVLFTCEEERRLAALSFRPYSACERVIAFGTADAPAANSAQDAAFITAAPQVEGRRFLLFLSRIHPKKGVDLLIKAFGAAIQQGIDQDIDLVIAGPDMHGLRGELEALAVTAGVADRIHWTGMLKGDAKWGAFRRCEAFILPSHQENFGIVVAEAMACGCPVLLSDKVNIWQEVVVDDAGFVEEDSVDGASALLSRFLALRADQREAMKRNARSSFLRRYDLRVVVEDFEQVLREVVVRNKSTEAEKSFQAAAY